MRVGLILALVWCAGCAGDGARPAAQPTRRGELPDAWAAYQAYCGLCPRSGGCCLKEADFAEPRWSEAAGPYLHALRDHYECMRGDTLIDARYEHPLTLPGDEHSYLPVETSLSWSCQSYACMASGDVMASQLDRALAAPVAHAEGASIACR